MTETEIVRGLYVAVTICPGSRKFDALVEPRIVSRSIVLQASCDVAGCRMVAQLVWLVRIATDRRFLS